MANIKSQIKRNRQTVKRTERNKAVRSELKTRTKAVTTGAADGVENLTELARAAQKRIDKAVTKGVIHKNAANRRKSRLARRVNAAGAADTSDT
ncbi:MAG: 30S ribosomal protein S20 [Acidimicrobiales bacterium]